MQKKANKKNEMQTKVNYAAAMLDEAFATLTVIINALANAVIPHPCKCKCKKGTPKAARWFNMAEVSNVCGVSKRTAERWACNGVFKDTKKVKGKFFVKATDEDLKNLTAKKGKKKCSAK